MSPELIGWLLLIVLFAIMATGTPIGFTMMLVGFVGYVILNGFQGALTVLGTSPFSQVSSYSLTVLPLFVFMGELAFYSGLIRGAYNAANKFIGHLSGGLAMATTIGCAAFAAICGSSVATASTMTSIAYPEMKARKYDDKLALGSIAAAGTLGILIPPSTPMVVYAVFASVSVGKLFMAGIVPGIILTIFFLVGIYVWAKMVPTLGPGSNTSTWRERISSLKGIWPVIVLIIVVLGGMMGGFFSATEAAGIGAFGALVIGLIMRTLNVKNITLALNATVKTTAMIFIILIGAMIFNYFIVLSGVPIQLSSFISGLSVPPLGILIAILLVYLVLGAIMDTMAMTVLTLPIFLPILSNLGFDLLWFGVVFVVMGEFAMITPPIGLNVFVISGMVKEVPMYTIFKGIVPFLAGLILLLVVLIAFPEVALFLTHASAAK